MYFSFKTHNKIVVNLNVIRIESYTDPLNWKHNTNLSPLSSYATVKSTEIKKECLNEKLNLKCKICNQDGFTM